MTSRDRELLEKWTANGDAKAFDTLVSGYSGLVYSACRRVLGSETAAEDMAQECFFQLAYKTPQIRTSLGAWLHKAATRLCLNKIRHESRLQRREERYSRESSIAIEATWDDVQEYVDEALEALPEELREPVVGSYLERKTHDVIAAELDISRSTVTRRIEKGIDGIRDHLKGKGVVASSASLGAMLTANAVEATPGGLAAALGKIALAGEGVHVVESIGSAGLFGGVSLIKGVVGLAALIAVVGGVWFMDGVQEGDDSSPTAPRESLSAITEDIENAESETGRDEVFPDAQETTTLTEVKMEAAEETEIEMANEAVLEEELVEEVAMTSSVSGRVYDALNNSGLEDVGIQIYEGGASDVLLQSTNTGSNGSFAFDGLVAGKYRLATDEVEGYASTKKGGISINIDIEVGVADGVTQDIPLSRGGVITGTAYLGREPLRDAKLSIYSEALFGNLEPFNITTDSEGHYRVEGLSNFRGSIQPRRTRADGTRQDGLAVTTDGSGTVEIENNKEAKVNFEFISGSASVEGRIYFENTDTPLQARIKLHFRWLQDGQYIEEHMYATTDETGYYLAEGLPEGETEMHIRPSGPGTGVRRVETITLRPGEHAVKDIIISSVSLLAEINNIPPGTKEIFVIAHAGEYEVELKNVADFLAIRNSMLAAKQYYPGDNVNYSGVIKGLKPGRYTITVSSMPASFDVPAIEAYGGFPKYFENTRYVSKFVTIEESDSEIELLFDLSAH